MSEKIENKTVSIVATAPEGILFVKDLKRRAPRWKLPSIHLKKNETHTEAAIREVEKKTGVVINITDKNRIKIQGYTNDLKYIYLINFSNSLKELEKMSTEWELVEIFLPKEIRFMGMNQVTPEHYKFLEIIELI